MGIEYCDSCHNITKYICDLCSYISFDDCGFFDFGKKVICRDCLKKLDDKGELNKFLDDNFDVELVGKRIRNP